MDSAVLRLQGSIAMREAMAENVEGPAVLIEVLAAICIDHGCLIAAPQETAEA